MNWLCIFPTDIVTQSINRTVRNVFQATGEPSIYALPPLVPVVELSQYISKHELQHIIPATIRPASYSTLAFKQISNNQRKEGILYFPIQPTSILNSIYKTLYNSPAMPVMKNPDPVLSECCGIFLCKWHTSTPPLKVFKTDIEPKNPTQYSIGLISITPLSERIKWYNACEWEIEWELSPQALPFEEP